MRNREGRSGPLKVGLKYCGGCRAGYDRVGLVACLKERLAGEIEWVAADSEDAEALLIVCGCKTACAEPGIVDCPVHRISAPEEGEQWIAKMRRRIPQARSGL